MTPSQFETSLEVEVSQIPFSKGYDHKILAVGSVRAIIFKSINDIITLRSRDFECRLGDHQKN